MKKSVAHYVMPFMTTPVQCGYAAIPVTYGTILSVQRCLKIASLTLSVVLGAYSEPSSLCLTL